MLKLCYFYTWKSNGYQGVIGEATFAEDHNEMVVVEDIETFSLSLYEHRMAPLCGICYTYSIDMSSF